MSPAILLTLTAAVSAAEPGYGITAETGGGVGGFTDSHLSGAAAGTWTARLTFGSRSHLGGEVAYTGSAQRLSDAWLVGNGVETAMRWNVLTGIWQPYLFGGLGWTHFAPRSGDVAQLPIGFGLAWRYGGFVADTRFTCRLAAPSPVIAGENLTTWELGARVGFEL
jgi:hypothetical protein